MKYLYRDRKLNSARNRTSNSIHSCLNFLEIEPLSIFADHIEYKSQVTIHCYYIHLEISKMPIIVVLDLSK